MHAARSRGTLRAPSAEGGCRRCHSLHAGKGKPAYGGRRANLDDDAYSDASSATNLTRGQGEQDLGEEDEDRITDVYQDNVELLFEKRWGA
jgi:hypothetical protein